MGDIPKSSFVSTAKSSPSEEQRQISNQSQEEIKSSGTESSKNPPEVSVKEKKRIMWHEEPEEPGDLYYETQLNNDELIWQIWTRNDKDETILIDKGILIDEFSLGVGHAYNEGMGDPFGGMIRGAFNMAKSYSPYINHIIRNKEEIKSNANKLVDAFISSNSRTRQTANNIIDTVYGAINSTGSFIDSAINDASGGRLSFEKAINGQFLSSFDMIKTFTGSEVGFNLPRLETIWIPGLKIRDLKEVNKSIKTRFEHVIDYILGDVVTLSEGSAYGLQTAPNNYRPDYAGLSSDKLVEFQGTYTLIIGKQYIIPNLVLKNFQYHPSLVKAMGLGGSPLYATVSYELEPASFMTKGQLKTILKNEVRVENRITGEESYV